MSRTVFIHCGLHKTGTKAIQTTFDENRDTLRGNGVLYPASGDEHTGHHNLAWEIAGDRRFQPSSLTIAKAVEQIAAFDGDAVLSSEDFESFLHRPQALSPRGQPLRAAGRAVCTVVYLRDPRSYAESLYAELLEHGYPGSFREYSREIRSSGLLRWREWTFQFNYRRIRAALAGYRDTRAVVRRYDDAARGGSVVTDFLPLVGLPADLLGAAAQQRRNERDPPDHAVSRFVANRAGRPLSDAEADGISRLFRQSALHGPAVAAWANLDRLCSDRTVRTVEALGHAPDPDAEAALAKWWSSQPLGARLWRFVAERGRLVPGRAGGRTSGG